MYKLIIVDDEKAIRNGIKDYFDWESMNFEVVALFEDGKEALAYIEQEEVDVVLTDIEMAEVSGLELAKHINEAGLPQKVVIISGYKEFEYARQAVHYGVEYYLLKPIKMEEVTQVFTKISEDLDATAKEDSNDELKELLPELIEQFWISILVGGARTDEFINKKKEFLNINISPGSPCALIDLVFSEKEGVLAEQYADGNYRNLVHNICSGEKDGIIYYPVCLSDEITKVVAIPETAIGERDFRAKVEQQLVEKCEIAMSLLKLELKMRIEKILADVHALAKYQCIFANSKNSEGTLDPLKPEDHERFIQKYKLIMGTINDGDFEELDHLVDAMFYEFRNMSELGVKHLCIDLFSMITGRLIKMGIGTWGEENSQMNYPEIIEADSIMELKRLTKHRLKGILNLVKEKRNINSKKMIDEAIKYIKKHYDEEISLEQVANRCFLNQAYFSRIFKQCTGATFTDYLIELRMEKAKELLAQGTYKVYEVSQRVGYKSEKYFFRIFKQYMGCSPSDYYRRKNLDEK